MHLSHRVLARERPSDPPREHSPKMSQASGARGWSVERPLEALTLFKY
jgi:hypothetical protein